MIDYAEDDNHVMASSTITHAVAVPAMTSKSWAALFVQSRAEISPCSRLGMSNVVTVSTIHRSC